MIPVERRLKAVDDLPADFVGGVDDDQVMGPATLTLVESKPGYTAPKRHRVRDALGRVAGTHNKPKLSEADQKLETAAYKVKFNASLWYMKNSPKSVRTFDPDTGLVTRTETIPGKDQDIRLSLTVEEHAKEDGTLEGIIPYFLELEHVGGDDPKSYAISYLESAEHPGRITASNDPMVELAYLGDQTDRFLDRANGSFGN